VYTTLWLLTDKKSEYLPRRPFPLPTFRLSRPFLRHICKTSPRGRRRRTQPKNVETDQRCHGRMLMILGVSGFRHAKAAPLVHNLRWNRQAGRQVYIRETKAVPTACDLANGIGLWPSVTERGLCYMRWRTLGCHSNLMSLHIRRITFPLIPPLLRAEHSDDTRQPRGRRQRSRSHATTEVSRCALYYGPITELADDNDATCRPSRQQ
jgi:hypothetical protein